RVGVARRFVTSFREIHHRVNTELRHLQRVLLRGRGDLAVLDRLHTGAAAVDRDDEDVALLAAGLDRGVGAERRRLVDRVDEVDVRVLLEAGLHRRLALGLVAQRVLLAHDARVVVLDAEPGREAVVTQHADADARGYHVLDRRLLAGVVGVELARRSGELGALGGRLLGRAFLHLHEEGVGLRLRDQPYLYLAAGAGVGAALAPAGCRQQHQGER